MNNFKTYLESSVPPGVLAVRSESNKRAWANDIVNLLILIYTDNPSVDVPALRRNKTSGTVSQARIRDYLNNVRAMVLDNQEEFPEEYKKEMARTDLDQMLVSYVEHYVVDPELHRKFKPNYEWLKRFERAGITPDQVKRKEFISRIRVGGPIKTEFTEGQPMFQNRTVGDKVNKKGKHHAVRNKKVRKKALDRNRELYDVHTCIMCGLRPHEFYEIEDEQQGARILYAHHVDPVRTGERETNVNDDIQILCGNCHVIADAEARINYPDQGDGLETGQSVDTPALQVPAVQ